MFREGFNLNTKQAYETEKLPKQKSIFRERIEKIAREAFIMFALVPGVHTDKLLPHLNSVDVAHTSVAETIDTSQTREKKENKKKNITEKEIRKGTWTDEAERIMIKVSNDGKDVYRDMGYIGATGTSGIPFEKFDEALREKDKKFVYSHTHFGSVLEYLGWSKADIKRFAEVPEEAPLLPPSMPDFAGLYALNAHYSTKGIEATSEVLDPTGKWKVKIDLKGKYFQMMTAAHESIDKSVVKYFSPNNQSLTNEEKQALESVDLLKTDTNELMRLIDIDPRLVRLRDRIEKIGDELADGLVKSFCAKALEVGIVVEYVSVK